MDKRRQAELDKYEARFGKYVSERSTFQQMHLQVGVQSFPIDWSDNPYLSEDENDARRRWYKRMICNALNELVKAECNTKG